MEIQTSADPAVFWLRARQFCHLGGRAPQSGEIVGLLKLKDDMLADLADTLKADEEDRKTDHAQHVAVTENVVVATVTAAIEMNLRQGDVETGTDSLPGDEALSEWEERQKGRAEELVTIHDTVNLETEVDGTKGALAETENSLAGDEASSEWEEERQKGRADELRSRLLLRRFFVAVRQHGWMRLACESAGVSTGGRAHSSH